MSYPSVSRSKTAKGGEPPPARHFHEYIPQNRTTHVVSQGVGRIRSLITKNHQRIIVSGATTAEDARKSRIFMHSGRGSPRVNESFQNAHGGVHGKVGKNALEMVFGEGRDDDACRLGEDHMGSSVEQTHTPITQGLVQVDPNFHLDRGLQSIISGRGKM